MASFCSSCGKPLSGDGRFCGSCGAANTPGAAQAVIPPVQQATPVVVAVAPAKTGSSVLKILLVIVLLGGAVVVMAAAGAFYYGKKKLAEFRKDSGLAAVLPGSGVSTPIGNRASTSNDVAQASLLTKEEVGAIIGVPVTSIEMTGKSDASYKTATMGVEAAIEVERKDDEADALQTFAAAKLVTQKMFGGKADPITGLGDEAIYGAYNVLYVRKNDVVLTITPPNLQQAAQMDHYNKMAAAPMGSDAQRAELQKMSENMKNDPVAGSMAKPDAMSGAVDLIQHAASDRGGEYETKARLMARQMAEKVLSKIGA
jgi:hypothetical protein